jgi:hypothetical protein
LGSAVERDGVRVRSGVAGVGDGDTLLAVGVGAGRQVPVLVGAQIDVRAQNARLAVQVEGTPLLLAGKGGGGDDGIVTPIDAGRGGLEVQVSQGETGRVDVVEAEADSPLLAVEDALGGVVAACAAGAVPQSMAMASATNSAPASGASRARARSKARTVTLAVVTRTGMSLSFRDFGLGCLGSSGTV